MCAIYLQRVEVGVERKDRMELTLFIYKRASSFGGVYVADRVVLVYHGSGWGWEGHMSAGSVFAAASENITWKLHPSWEARILGNHL